MRKVRNLVLVLGDQLDLKSPAFDGFDRGSDMVWMAEVVEESEYVWSHKVRIAVFLSAMRHFRDELRRRGFPLDYHLLDAPGNKGSFSAELERSVRRYRPERLVVVQPGEFRVLRSLQDAAGRLGLELDVLEDCCFLCTRDEFAEHVASRKALLFENFYHLMRRKLGVLVKAGKPVGGKWNYDAENRKSFPAEGPGGVPQPKGFAPDDVTRGVIDLVNRRFAEHPGRLDRFDFPVTARQARAALDDFIENRLGLFGRYEDAMWTGEPFLYHSRLSSVLNLHLLDPRDVYAAAVSAYEAGGVPLNSAEAFVRQVIGWREYIRGVYWQFMPDYERMNFFDADLPLPGFYWTGETDANCLRHVLTQTLEYGFAHHIQRLMVAGLFALLAGVDPHEVHRWFLAIYVDAVEWAEMPNVLGMSQFADGGLMASKPYAAGGRYIKKMSNYCQGCRYNPQAKTGDDACPFTVCYWDFLMRNRAKLSKNTRMALQLRNLDRYGKAEMSAIRKKADEVRTEMVQPVYG